MVPRHLEAILFLPLLLGNLCSSSIPTVDPSLKDSVAEFLQMSKATSSKDSSEQIMTNHLQVRPTSKKSQTIVLMEEALELIYDELFGRNGSVHGNARAIMSPRQSFFSNGLASLSEYLMSLVENSLEDFPSLPRLEAQECMKRSVCEAHNQPKKYGLMGLILQLLFPPYTKTEESTNLVSKYQLAARYGRQSNANCGIQYDGCMINLLDVIQAVVNAFIR